MPGRYNDAKDPLGLNSGFAAPDPKLAGWKPPADRVPTTGTLKDPRLAEEKRWGISFPKRASRIGSDASSSVASPERKAERLVTPKLDGTGCWGEWGVKEPLSGPPMAKPQEEKAKIPVNIESMNKVLSERARDAAAATKAATTPNRFATSSVEIVSPVPAVAAFKVPVSVPPHLRKKMIELSSGLAPKTPAAPQGLSKLPFNPVFAPPTSGVPFRVPSGEVASDAILTVGRSSGGLAGTPSIPKIAVATQALPERPVYPIVVRPPGGSYFTVPSGATAPDARRPSSATLVNGEEDINEHICEEDKKLATRLQMEEYGIRDFKQGWGRKIVEKVNEDLDIYKAEKGIASRPLPALEGSSLFERLHKVHETVWKQEAITMPGYNKNKDALYEMDEDEFGIYHSYVCHFYRMQWNARFGRVEQILKLQGGVEAKSRFTVDELLAMTYDGLTTLLKKVVGASKDQHRDSTFRLSEDALSHEDNGADQTFDSDGYGHSDDDDGNSDSDEGYDNGGVVVFKGRAL